MDVILDMVAGDYVERDIHALADDGRIVILAILGGPRGTVAFDQVLRRRLTITGATLRPRSTQFKGAIAAALHEKVWPLIESGRIRPVVHSTFPLAAAASAHRLMESGDHIGKIVLDVAGPAGSDVRTRS